jgi:hypothetical protein
MALGSLMWGIVIALAALFAWSVGSSAAWIGFALVLVTCTSIALSLQRTR